MSHFCVLVVTDQNPKTDPDSLTAALAPFHEFECTGRSDQYVVDVDRTDEARSVFGKSSETRIRDPEGNLHDRFDERGEWKLEFSQPDDDRFSGGSRRKEFIPQGYEKVEVPTAEFVSLAKWASDYYGWPIVCDEAELDLENAHKYGHILVDAAGEVVRCIDRTNPNSKWDWWQIGGRYSGRLAPGYNPELDPANIETCLLCEGSGMRNDPLGVAHRLTDPSYTCNGCGGKGRSPKWPSQWADVGNTAKWGELDIAAMKAAAVADRRATVEELRAKSGLTFEDFETGLQAYRSANEVWKTLPEPKPRGTEFVEWLFAQAHGELAVAYQNADTWRSIELAERQTLSEWIDAAPALSAYALLLNGTWCAKGEMGWFGASYGDKEDWPAQLQSLLNRISPEQYVTVVDCHI